MTFAVSDLPRNMASKIEVAENGCWLWTGSTTPAGYGQSWNTDVRRVEYAHRRSYLLLCGAIPPGLQLDHLCRVRNCVNPAHLEPVTHRENSLRGVGIAAQCFAKTHCANGHLFVPETTGLTSKGWRYCRICKREYMRRYHRQVAQPRRVARRRTGGTAQA